MQYLAITLQQGKQVIKTITVPEPPPYNYYQLDYDYEPTLILPTYPEKVTVTTSQTVYVKQQLAILDERYDFYLDKNVDVNSLNFTWDEILHRILSLNIQK